MPPQRSHPCGLTLAIVATERRYCQTGANDTLAYPF